MTLRLVMCAAISSMIVAGPLAAQDPRPGVTPAPAAGSVDKKEDPFAVVKVLVTFETGYVGERVEVLRKSTIDARKKQVDAFNKQQSDDYEKARQDALAAKKKFTAVAPKPQTLKVVADNFKTEAEANTFAEKEKKKTMQPPADKPGEKPKGDKPK
ncbi:MAG TPA: hypothetical protein VK348_14660 [Planctomycetota bacterium]|nr:hypothetical protein [Planctomycetota bacterium]